MPNILHPSFLTDPQEYEQAKRLWQSQWEEILRRTRQQAAWQSPWIATGFADGSPCRDGNPIFAAVQPNLRLGVRVNQLDPSEEDNADLYFWLDTFAKGTPQAIEELVISCILTRKNLLDAANLMYQWVSREGEIELAEPKGVQCGAAYSPRPADARLCVA